MNTNNIQTVFAIALLCIASSTANAQQSLTITNDDSLSGKILEMSKTEVVWKSQLFSDPLKFPMSNIRHISFDREKGSPESISKYQVRMATGDLLFVDITKVDDDHVYTQSPRHGELKLDRSQVASIHAFDRQQIAQDGFANFDKWRSYRGGKDDWRTNGTELETTTVNANVYLERKELPDDVEIQLDLKFNETPDFSFGLEVPKSIDALESVPRIETWDGTLVLAYGDDFEVLIDEIAEDLRVISLNVQWNRKSNEISVFDSLGELLANARLPAASDNSKPGFYFGNLEGGLKVTRFRVAPQVAGRKAIIGELKARNGEVFASDDGSVSFDGSQWSIGENSIKAEDFYAALFSKPSPQPESDDFVLSYRDGSELRGTVASASTDQIRIETRFHERAIACRMQGLAGVKFGTDKPSLSNEYGHILVVGEKTLHGGLSIQSGAREKLFKWTQAGASSSVTISQESQSQVRLAKRDQKVQSAPSGMVDALHLENGDMVFCKTVSIDEKSIKVRTGSGEHVVELKNVKALDLGRKEKQQQVLFEDSGWNLLREMSPTRIEEGRKSIRLDNRTRLTHSSLNGDQVRFKLKWQNIKRISERDMVLVHVFNSTASTDDGLAIKFGVSPDGKQIMVGRKSSRLSMYFGETIKPIRVQSNEANVSLQIVDSRFVVKINGRKAFDRAFDRRHLQGRSFSVSTVAPEYGESNTWWEISDVATNYMFGRTSDRLLIGEQMRNEILTIPRIQRPLPPRNVISSVNGDLLRGAIVQLDANRLRFMIGAREYTFERENISNIVWFHEILDPENVEDQDESETAAVEEMESHVQVLLDDGQRITAMPQQFENNSVITSSASLGNIAIAVPKIVSLQFNPVKELPDDLPYSSWTACFARPAHKMNPGGGGEAPKSPLIGTMAPDFETTFAADGKPFKLSNYRGKIVVLDFWATWCGPCVASMPSVIEEVASFDSGDVVLFGVNQGEADSQINNFVEKRGWELNVLLDEKTSIGTDYKADAIPHTVVIDREGNISDVMTGAGHDVKAAVNRAMGIEEEEPQSPLIGKMAPDFETTISADGESFKLSDYRGKIVVLDFWATWCGPCVGSMPSVIEDVSSFDSEDIVLFGVNQGEAKDKINPFVEGKEWDLKVLLDEQTLIGAAYKVDGIPHTVIIDRDGKVAVAMTGSGHDVKKAIESVRTGEHGHDH